MALSDIVAAGNNPLEFAQFYLLTRARLGLAETSVRERVRQYATQGILIEIGGKYTVSDYAIGKFNLSTGQPLDDSSAAESYPHHGEGPQDATAPH